MFFTRLKSNLAFIVSGLTLALLSACGGGGTTTAPVTTQIVLSSSSGTLSRYQGAWGACGIVTDTTSTSRSGRAGFAFAPTTSATIIPGTISVALYASTDCSGSVQSSGSNRFTATYISSANTVSTASDSVNVVFSGTADRLSIQEYNAATGALIDTAQTQYAAFSNGFSELRIRSTPVFSSTNVVLRR